MSGVGSQGTPEVIGDQSEIVCDIMGAADTIKNFTWNEIDGVRRVTEIEYTSATVDADSGDTNVFTKTFTYQGVDPFDLVDIVENLTVT